MTARRKNRLLVRLLSESGYRCCFCLRKLDRWSATREHIVPRSRGGSDAFANMATSCNDCNHARGDAEFYAFEEQTAKRPDEWASPHPQRVAPWEVGRWR